MSKRIAPPILFGDKDSIILSIEEGRSGTSVYLRFFGGESSELAAVCDAIHEKVIAGSEVLSRNMETTGNPITIIYPNDGNTGEKGGLVGRFLPNNRVQLIYTAQELYDDTINAAAAVKKKVDHEGWNHFVESRRGPQSAEQQALEKKLGAVRKLSLPQDPDGTAPDTKRR